MNNSYCDPPRRKLELSLPEMTIIILPKIRCVRCGNYLGFNVIEESFKPVIEVMSCNCEREKETQMLIDSLPDLLKKAGYDLDKIKK